MLTQVLRSPASPRRYSAAQGIALYLWMRFRRMFELIAAVWLISALADQMFLTGRIASFADAVKGPHLISMVLIPGLLLLAPMVAISEIDENLWTLPVRTQTLVGWLMCYGCAGVALFWIANAVCVWRPAGLDVPIWWPAALLVAIQATALGVRCQPFTFGALHALIYSLCTIFLVVGGGIAYANHVTPEALGVRYLTVAALAYILGVVGAERMRSGDWIGGVSHADVNSGRTLQGKFRSASRAQAWFEWRNHGFYITAAVAGLGALTLPVLFIPLISEIRVITLLTHGAHHVYANMWAANVPPFLVVAVLYFSLVFGCASPGMRESDKTLSQFLATRPVDCTGLVAGKLRAAALSAGAAWASLAPFFLIWMLLPAYEYGQREFLGQALWSALATVIDARWVMAGVAGFLLLLLLSWKLQVDTLFLQLTGRPWAPWAFTGIIVLPLAIPPFYSHVLHNAAFQPYLAGAAVGAALVKLASTAFIVRALRRRGIISARTLNISLAVWAGAALLLIGLFCATLAPYHIAWWQTAAGVLLFMPGVRLALAPLALAWDRSR
ncbi:hypothetical protein CCAX7_57980 [Capsulimonas corticalis]|uniref:Uncharacterized protein n=1 Tax=Capsulimonas corticalis TaxID=2219043 RepID=A0A402D043_9BACT|nr:hypothetical protein [Capsulimonas corticalis]BDI33747.1 hypothetical protein CCAX7_57980 [Capsulimonas corticalis]